MNTSLKRAAAAALAIPLAAGIVASCDMMTEDRSDCPTGLYMTFRADYNLDNSDVFPSQVGSVTLLVYDEQDNLVATYEESNTDYAKPLGGGTYTMHITDLTPGRYRFIALAQQAAYRGTRAVDRRPLFVRSGTALGSKREDLSVTLERQKLADGMYEVENYGLPLDTLWYGRDRQVDEWVADTDDPFVQVYNDRPTYDTIYMMRDMNQISVTLRDIDDPRLVDVGDYDFKIVDHNAVLLWDNSVDETDTLIYTPYVTWNDEDPTEATSPEGYPLTDPGYIAHADFMTSRLIKHDSEEADKDALLVIRDKEQDRTVVELNIADILSRTRNYQLIQRYTAQQFLDRAYDYDLSIYLKGGKYQYVTITVGVLSWTYRTQFEQF